MITQSQAFLPVLTQAFGDLEVKIKTSECTFAQSDLVAEGIKKYRIDGSPLKDYPPLENESKEAWAKRAQKTKKEKTAETINEYADKAFKPKQLFRDDAYAVVNILCEAFGNQEAPTESEFANVNTAELRCFLFDVLNLLELPEEAHFFRPHQIHSGTAAPEGGGTQQT